MQEGNMSSVLVEHEATVKQYAEALGRLNAELEQRIAERTAALQRSNEELQQFAHTVSHDLKEPLRGMHNYAHLLLEDLGSTVSGEARAKLQTVSALAQRMEDLINSLLHFCRLGQENLAYEDTDVSMMVHEVLNLLHITLTQQDIEVRMPQPLPVVRCDRARVREVFHNLILNAIKYNDKPHKWVEIGVFPAPSVGMTPSSTFYIRDNGIGIRPHHMEMIFAMFKRLHPRRGPGRPMPSAHPAGSEPPHHRRMRSLTADQTGCTLADYSCGRIHHLGPATRDRRVLSTRRQ